MLDRIVRAIRLDSSLFRQVADNPVYMSEAVIIAVLVALISSFGSVPGVNNPLGAYIAQVVISLVLGWALWAVVAYFIGTAMFGGRSSIDEMLRVLGYARAPQLLGVFAFIPCIGWLFAVAGGILSLIAAIIAIRESMEFDTGKAIVTAIIGWVIFAIGAAIVGGFFAVVTIPFR